MISQYHQEQEQDHQIFQEQVFLQTLVVIYYKVLQYKPIDYLSFDPYKCPNHSSKFNNFLS